jgi:hypothetical protein
VFFFGLIFISGTSGSLSYSYGTAYSMVILKAMLYKHSDVTGGIHPWFGFGWRCTRDSCPRAGLGCMFSLLEPLSRSHHGSWPSDHVYRHAVQAAVQRLWRRDGVHAAQRDRASVGHRHHRRRKYPRTLRSLQVPSLLTHALVQDIGVSGHYD